MTRYVVPISRGAGQPTLDRSSAVEALRFVREVRATVSEAKARVDVARDLRVAQLLAGKRAKNGFLLGQTALLASGISPALQDLVGTLPVPVATPTQDFLDKLTAGDINALRLSPEFGFLVSAAAPGAVACMYAGRVSGISDSSYADTCPSGAADPLSSGAALERVAVRACQYGRYVEVTSTLDGGQQLKIVYGLLAEVSVEVGAQLKAGDALGAGSYTAIDAYDGAGERLANFALYIQRPRVDVVAQSEGYGTDSAAPYGPHWRAVRPGGYPESGRRCSARGAADAAVRAGALSAQNDGTFARICVGVYAYLTEGGYVGLPSRTFDVRGTASEVHSGAFDAIPPLAFEDTGPFPRELDGGIISDPYRDGENEGFDSRWGAFQVDLDTWRALKTGFSFRGEASQHATGLTEPWSGTVDDEILPVLNAMGAVWRALSSSPLVYRALGVAGVAISPQLTSQWGQSITQVSDESALRASWSALSALSSTSGMSGDTFKRIVEAIVSGSEHRSLKNTVSELAGSQPVTPTPTRTDLNGPRPHRFVQVPADGIGSGQDVLSYGYTQISSEFSERYKRVYLRANELGGWVTSGGGRRALSASRPLGIGLHNIGRAVDLAPYTGLFKDANTDPNMKYLVIRDEPGSKRSKFTIWAIVFPDKPGYNAAKAAEAEAAGIIQNRTWTVDRIRSLNDESTYTWTGKAFNLTAIFEANGFSRISPINDYLVDGKFRGVEWWHYEIHDGLVPNVTTIGDEVHKLYTYQEAALGPQRHPNYDIVINKKWRGGSFR